MPATQANQRAFTLTREETGGRKFYVAALAHNQQIRFVGETAEEATGRLEAFLRHLDSYNEVGWV